jgi:hypothetical protein
MEAENLGFVVDKVAVMQVSSEYFDFLLRQSFLRFHSSFIEAVSS